MASAVKSLWSAQIKPDILSPRQILNAQAAALVELTGGILLGELSESKNERQEVVLALDMLAPTIRYRHRVLTARHSPTLIYPVLLKADVFERHITDTWDLQTCAEIGIKPESQADSDEELVKLVEKVLKSPTVVAMAQSLIALSNEARTPVNYIRYLKGLNEAERQSAIDEKVAETSHIILDCEAFTHVIAETSLSGWGIDEYEIQNINLGDEECIVRLRYSASGDQTENQVYSGDKVTGIAEAVIDSRGAVEYRGITAEAVHEYEEPDSEEDAKEPQ